MLTPQSVVPYLIKRGLLGPAAVVDAGVTVVDAARRNLNLKVLSESGSSYLVKQGVDAERAHAVANEAALYSLLAGQPFMPRVYLYDPSEDVIVVELLRGARSIGEHSRVVGRFSTALARQLGRSLAALHSLPLEEVAARSPTPIVRREAPWALSLHLPELEFYRQMSVASIELVKVIQQFPRFEVHLYALGREWSELTQQGTPSLIHYDIKWDNLLVAPGDERRNNRRRQLKIVDWELAGLGEPCWDVGAVFGEYLELWLLSIPVTGGQLSARFVETARYPLEIIQPAMRAFWSSYAGNMRLDRVLHMQWLMRSVRYAAARLLQTAFEQTQTAPQLTSTSLSYLQLGLNILERPVEAAVHLLSIPVSIAALGEARTYSVPEDE